MENEVISISSSNIEEIPTQTSIIYKPNEKHYEGSIQPIEFMQAQMSKDEFIGFLKGNVIKYVSRAGKKSSATMLSDLTKARRYLEWLIQTYMGDTINPRN